MPTTVENTTRSSRPRSVFARASSTVITSGVIVGLGAVAGMTPAAATPDVTAADCTDSNTVSSITGGTRADIQTLLTDGASLICLVGSFDIDETLLANGSVTLFGNPGATLDGDDVTQIFSAEGMTTTTIRNLTFQNGYATDGGAVKSFDVDVANSTFIDNAAGDRGGAIYAAYAAVAESTFLKNDTATHLPDLTQAGGAIYAEETIDVTSSVFDDNSARDGGALATPNSITVENSSFVGNRAWHEGGALLAEEMSVSFSTFFDNEAAVPVVGEENPGVALYVAYTGVAQTYLYGNVFAGSSDYPQVGVGEVVDPDAVVDLGGNVFSTSASIETDVTPDVSSLFDQSIAALFGTDRVLADHGGSTLTLALAENSPAIDIVPMLVEDRMAPSGVSLSDTDQRGEPRTGEFYDAGSFEFQPSDLVTEPELAATGSDPNVAGWLVGIAALLLGSGVAVAIAARRRTRC